MADNKSLEDRFRAHVGVTFPAGSLEKFKEYADAQGKSLSALICELLDKQIEKDGLCIPKRAKSEEYQMWI